MFKFGACLVVVLSVVVLLSEKRLQVEASGKTCYSNYICDSDQRCCTSKGSLFGTCRYSCIGRSCSTDSDCGGSDECCSSDVCTTFCSEDVAKALATWIIAVIVVGVLLVVVLPVSIAIFCCCCAASASRRPVQSGVVLAQPCQPGATVVATQNSQVQSGAVPYQSPPPFQSSPYINQGQAPPPQQPQIPPPEYKAQYWGWTMWTNYTFLNF